MAQTLYLFRAYNSRRKSIILVHKERLRELSISLDCALQALWDGVFARDPAILECDLIAVLELFLHCVPFINPRSSNANKLESYVCRDGMILL